MSDMAVNSSLCPSIRMKGFPFNMNRFMQALQTGGVTFEFIAGIAILQLQALVYITCDLMAKAFSTSQPAGYAEMYYGRCS